MVLFQWQYQSFHPAIDFGLQVSGVNLGVSSHCNAEQLVSPDHHPMYLKGVVVFCKSTILLHLNALVVMSPHGLMAFANPFQLSLSPETAFPEPTGSSYPLLILLPGGSYGHFVCVWGSDAVPRSCIHIRVKHILPGWVWVRWGLITGTPQSSFHITIMRISGGPGWTRWRLVGSCSCCLELVLVSGTNLCMSSLPCAELCSLLASTSWESTQVLLWWWSGEPSGSDAARTSSPCCVAVVIVLLM